MSKILWECSSILYWVRFKLVSFSEIKNSVYLCIYHTPKVIRVYSTFLLNFGITDFLTCATDFFVFQRYLDSARDFIEILKIIRVIPGGNALPFISNGPCTLLNPEVCFVG